MSKYHRIKREKGRVSKKFYILKANKLIKNYELYKEFYKKIDQLQSTFIKVKGHSKKSSKDEIDTIFALVDKASRAALRIETEELQRSTTL